jgi:hypothetical protein
MLYQATRRPTGTCLRRACLRLAARSFPSRKTPHEGYLDQIAWAIKNRRIRSGSLDFCFKFIRACVDEFDRHKIYKEVS